MSVFQNKAGRIYTEKADDVGFYTWEVWFEDFCILGTGNTEIEALKDARQHTANIKALVEQALAETITPATTAKDDNYQEQVGTVAGAGGDQ